MTLLGQKFDLDVSNITYCVSEHQAQTHCYNNIILAVMELFRATAFAILILTWNVNEMLIAMSALSPPGTCLLLLMLLLLLRMVDDAFGF